MKLSNRKRRKTYNNGRYAGIILLGILFFLLNVPKTGFAQQDSISIGQTVQITSNNVNLRKGPGLSFESIAKMSTGTLMKVVGGPSVSDGYTWWELEDVSGRGWAAENYLKVVEGAPAPRTTPESDGSGCEYPYPAIQYCPQKDESIYSILIDLNDPHVRIETVMANDTTSVNTSNREYVRNMGNRHQEEGAVVVINADYFGAGHGPEGFTVVNGKRLDGSKNNDGDDGAVYRSSIAFSKSGLDGGNSPIAVSIQRFEKDVFTLDTEKMFNAVGGGPQIVFNGNWDWIRGRNQSPYNRYPACPLNVANVDVINGECFQGTWEETTKGWENPAKMWTVVGRTADGHLIMLLAKYPDIQSTLTKYQIQEAIKLDGGGSSQLWYNKVSIVPGDGRQVANGLMVFYKNDFKVEKQPQWPVVVSGENLEIEIILINAGADTWTQKDYAFVSTKNPWDMSIRIKLPQDVKAGESVTLKWQSDPIDKTWGIYSLDFQVTDHGNEFPTTPIDIQMIVIPEDLAEKKQELEQKIRDWIDKGIEDIEREITTWIEQQVQGLLQWVWNQITTWLYENCYLPITALIFGALLLRRRYNSP